MSRKDFMEQLEKLLMDVPVEERVEAMAFYHSYFEDAGEENEERVIRELESPQKVAASIKADMKLEEDNAFAPAVYDPGEDTASGGSDTQAGNGTWDGSGTQAGNGAWDGGYTQAGNGAWDGTCTQAGNGAWDGGYTQAGTAAKENGKKGQTEDNTFKIVMIVIVAVLTSPIWIGLLGGLLGVLLGAIGTVLGCAVAVVLVAFAFYLAGVALCTVSIAAFSGGAAAVGCGLLGAGLLILALAVLSTIVCVWVFGSFVPWAVKGIASLCKKLFQKRQKGGCAA